MDAPAERETKGRSERAKIAVNRSGHDTLSPSDQCNRVIEQQNAARPKATAHAVGRSAESVAVRPIDGKQPCELSSEDSLHDHEIFVCKDPLKEAAGQQVAMATTTSGHLVRPVVLATSRDRKPLASDRTTAGGHLKPCIGEQQTEAPPCHLTVVPCSQGTGDVPAGLKERRGEQGSEGVGQSAGRIHRNEDEAANLQDDVCLHRQGSSTQGCSHDERSGSATAAPCDDRQVDSSSCHTCIEKEQDHGSEQATSCTQICSPSSSSLVPLTTTEMWQCVKDSECDLQAHPGITDLNLREDESKVDEEDLLEWVHSVLGRRHSLQELRDGYILCEIVDHAYGGIFPMRRIYKVAAHDYQRERNFNVLHFFLSSLGVETEVNVASLWEASMKDLLQFFDWLRTHCESLQRKFLKESNCSPSHGLWRSADDIQLTPNEIKGNSSWRTFPILPITTRGLQERVTDRGVSNTFTKLTQADGLVRVAGCQKIESVSSPARRLSVLEPCPYCSSTVDKQLICNLQELDVTQQLSRLLDSVRASNSGEICMEESIQTLERSVAETESLLSKLVLRVDEREVQMPHPGQVWTAHRALASGPSTRSYLRAKMLIMQGKTKHKMFKLRRDCSRYPEATGRNKEDASLWHTARSDKTLHEETQQEERAGRHAAPHDTSCMCSHVPAACASPHCLDFTASPISHPSNRRKRMFEDAADNEQQHHDEQGEERRLGDVGIVVGFDRAQKCFRVQHVRAGSPAEKSRAIEEGDELVWINGCTEFSNAAEVEQKLMGDQGSLVRVRIKRRWHIFDVTLSRDSVVALWI